MTFCMLGGSRNCLLLAGMFVMSMLGCGGGGYSGGGGGPTVPYAPAGLQATTGNAQVALTWTASAGATSYHLKRSTTAGGPYAQIATQTTTSDTDAGLTNGTAYYYVVTATNSAGESGNSNEAKATPVTPAPDVTITIDPSKTKAISPYIYGINFFAGNAGATPLITFDRAGGNRWTAYNWETNASNAGNDFHYNNDNFLSSSTIPAEAVRCKAREIYGIPRSTTTTTVINGSSLRSIAPLSIYLGGCRARLTRSSRG